MLFFDSLRERKREREREKLEHVELSNKGEERRNEGKSRQ
jgi:hypothetical protein